MPVRLRESLTNALRGPLLRGFAAYGSAEVLVRIVRLIAVVVIARRLAPAIVGEAALTLTIFEIVRIAERTGTGARIVAAPVGELAATCNSAWRLCWFWSVALLAVQGGAALLLWRVWDQGQAAAMLAVLGCSYLFMAGGHVQYHLAMRAGANTRLARLNAAQTIADHILTAALLLVWASPWSVVLPKLLTAPLWLAMARRVHPWARDAAAGEMPMGRMLQFSGSILASEALVALRTQGDNLIVGAMMGTSALGTYYFAFNAGLGIVSSLTGAFALVAFPLLCAAQGEAARAACLRRIVWLGLAIFVPLVLLQALAAPYYVPIVFGRHWAFAGPLIGTLCLAGLPLLASAITASWLRAEGRVGMDAASSALAAASALGGLAIGVRWDGLQGAAIGLVAGQSLATLAYATHVLIPALRGGQRAAFTQEQRA